MVGTLLGNVFTLRCCMVHFVPCDDSSGTAFPVAHVCRFELILWKCVCGRRNTRQLGHQASGMESRRLLLYTTTQWHETNWCEGTSRPWLEAAASAASAGARHLVRRAGGGPGQGHVERASPWFGFRALFVGLGCVSGRRSPSRACTMLAILCCSKCSAHGDGGATASTSTFFELGKLVVRSPSCAAVNVLLTGMGAQRLQLRTTDAALLLTLRLAGD